MAIRKVCGIETEYGIHAVAPGEQNPTAASSMLINAYVSDLAERVGWDFEDESPGNDARGFAREGSAPPEIETHLVNTVLTNGARYYVDHAHPEFSTPECATPLQLVAYDKAGERVLARSMAAAQRMLPAGQSIVVYKNNSDGKGNSYGCHENYLLDRALPFQRIVQHLTPHLVTRQVYTGAGKVGRETGRDPGRDAAGGEAGKTTGYQLTQRADFFEEEVGLETTLKRPIINTRDEPHADAAKYRRLHVIVGDANLAEVATLLKVGVTAVVLAMIEDDFFGTTDLSLANPVQAMHHVSHDLTLSQQLELRSGRKATAISLQWELHDLARKYAEERGFEYVGDEGQGRAVLDRWEAVLVALESEPSSLARQLDWVAKLQMIEAYMGRHGCTFEDGRVAALDLQYHDVRPERSLYERLGMERVVGEDEVQKAVTEPPPDTRAYFRGRCLQRFAKSIVAANWDSIVLDVGGDPLRRIPMMEPLKGTAAHVDTLFEGCDTPTELLERLGS